MKYIKLLSILIICSLNSPTAQAQDWFVDIGLGISELDLDIQSNLNPGEDLVSDDAGFSGLIGLGYYFSDSVFAKVSYSDYGSLTPVLFLGQNVDYSSVRAGVGFELPASGRWAFTAEIGVAMWDAEGTESFIFNPGDEETASVDGTDLYVRLGGVFRLNDNVDFGVYWDTEDPDIGSALAYHAGVRFKF